MYLRLSRIPPFSRNGLKALNAPTRSFNKLDPYSEIKREFQFNDADICYIGDDVLDIPILNLVGFSVAVPNAREEVKAICDYVTVALGGRGAVREIIELILKRQGKFKQLVESLIDIKLP